MCTERTLSENDISSFLVHLCEEEKSENTKEKYMRDVRKFINHIGDNKITKEVVISYKKYLISSYKPRSVNSMLASLNSLFDFLGWREMKVRTLRLQKEVFCPEEKELSREEYKRLCKKADERMNLILQTICATGIRVSELKYITAEAVRDGQAVVSLKGKTRVIIIVKGLQKKLLKYVKKHGIRNEVFVTRTGRPVSRISIWREMKRLSVKAGVEATKVYPHNLRHLFARTFYKAERDIAKLADILGHSSIETTRIYLITTGEEHRGCMERMHLLI